jgi:arsenate reductase
MRGPAVVSRKRIPPVARRNDSKNAGPVCLHGKCRPFTDGRGAIKVEIRGPFRSFLRGKRQAKVSIRATEVMREIGIDISHHRSKPLAEFSGASFDLAVTLCNNAHTICPFVFDTKKTIHHGFADPHLTPGTDEFILNEYRRVRDEISNWIEEEFLADPKK